MDFLQIQNESNKQRLREQTTYKDFTEKDKEAKNAFITYFDAYMSKFDDSALLLAIKERNEAITDLNGKMKDLLDINPNNPNYLFQLYSEHIIKVTREKQIIEIILTARHYEKENK